MSMQDPIADMLTRIRNAQARFTEAVVFPSSKLKVAMACVLQSEGYITSWEKTTNDGHPALKVNLKYYNDQPVIAYIQRVSKPSLRVYMSSAELNKYTTSLGVKNGLGVAIVSNSDGVMTHQHAIKNGKGGEVLCYVN